MKRSFTRTLLAPALLAVAIAPLALSASAAPQEGWQHGGSEDHRQQHEQRRQALFERAGIDEETRQALEKARREYREALQELRESHRQRMDEILDDEQREALTTARRELRDEHREARRAEHREAMQQRLSALVDTWELSDAERESLREAREAIYTDMQDLRGREFDSPQARREAMRELRESHQEALGRILSDEQLAEMREALEPRPRPGLENQGHDGGKDSGKGETLDD
ncbi:hypothetical protein ACGTNG_01505 [Halomonas sp. 1390]|uniref:hypothetical protein n=1 Tax=Halomonas sp. B23F22_3 TaxID=3459516 RepID=UPI00373E4F49